LCRVKKLKDDLDRLENQLGVAEHNLTNADSQRQAALREKSRLQKALTTAENQLAELKDELNEVNSYSNCCSLDKCVYRLKRLYQMKLCLKWICRIISNHCKKKWHSNRGHIYR